MRIIKKLFQKAYSTYLRIRFNLPAGSARMTAISFLKDYRNKKLPFREIRKIHRRGFLVTDWCLMGLTEDNYKNYMNNVDYFRLHPINGIYSNWIDDKLTLKYLCAGTALDAYMPEYYYQIDQNGRVLCLMDVPVRKHTASARDVAAQLKEKGTLAIKQVAGSIGSGFYKGEYRDGTYYLNGKAMTEQEFCKCIGNLRNYLVIEYLRPHEAIAAYCPDTVNCIRYLAGRVDGKPKLLKGYIRFGTKRSGFVENYNAGGVLCYLDETGRFLHGNVMSENGLSNCQINTHPDSGTELTGTIPMWDEILKAVDAFSLHFPQLNYMGLDFVVTLDNKVKVLEINSLTSLDGIQLDGPVFASNSAGFYKGLLGK